VKLLSFNTSVSFSSCYIHFPERVPPNQTYNLQLYPNNKDILLVSLNAPVFYSYRNEHCLCGHSLAIRKISRKSTRWKNIACNMMVAKRPRHGGKAAMMWASPTSHPGRARMMSFFFRKNSKPFIISKKQHFNYYY
jgi:hypothetical protein